MQISKKQLQSIINEETERVKNEQDVLETLLESYARDYGNDGETVSKDALIDFLHVLDENKIPLAAFEAFMESLPEQSVTGILSEVVQLSEEQTAFVDLNGQKYSVRLDGRDILYVKDSAGSDVSDPMVLLAIKQKLGL